MVEIIIGAWHNVFTKGAIMRRHRARHAKARIGVDIA